MKPLAFNWIAGMVTAAAAVLYIGASPSHAQVATDANVDRELNIVEEHIVEDSFERSMSVAVDQQNLRLNIGAYISTARIDLTLRGVTGHVVFRASLEPIRERLERLRNRVELK